MANNLGVSEGSGKVVATDDVAGVHYQLIKIAGGTEDAAERIEGTAANGLEVDITRVVPGFGASNLGKRINDPFADADVGVVALAIRDDSLSALTPVDGDYVGLRVDANGRLFVNLDLSTATVTTNGQPTTSGGCSITTLQPGAGGNATNVKASAGQLYGYYILNTAAAVRKVCFYNNAGTPTHGTSVVMQVPVPAGAAANLWMPQGIAFSTGIAISTGGAVLTRTDTTGITSGDLDIELWWK